MVGTLVVFKIDAGVGANKDSLNVVIPFIVFVDTVLPNVIVPVDVENNEIGLAVAIALIVLALIVVNTLKTPFIATLEELEVPIFIIPV